jgi:AraC-like DNA-binding protein
MFSILLNITTSTLVFLTFHLVVKQNKVNKLANNWLIFFFIALIDAFIGGVLRASKSHLDYPYLFKIGDLLAFAIAPSLFLAVKYFTLPTNHIRQKDWLHFIPAFLFFCFNAHYWFYSQKEIFEMVYKKTSNNSFFKFIEILLVLQCFIYLIFSIKRILNYHKNREIYDASNIENLKWLQYFLYGVTGLLLLWAVSFINFINEIITFGYLLCIYYLGYYIINQKELYPFSENEKKQIITLTEEEEEMSTSKKRLFSGEDLEKEKNKLLLLMEKEKPYLDNELNLAKLATLSQISMHELSFVLNEGFQENFNQFVNRYRVAESKKILLDPTLSHLTMLGVAYESGFNSKTIFNITFKKLTGQTPSQFRKNR